MVATAVLVEPLPVPARRVSIIEPLRALRHRGLATMSLTALLRLGVLHRAGLRAVVVAVIVAGVFTGVNNTVTSQAVMTISPVERPVAVGALVLGIVILRTAHDDLAAARRVQDGVAAPDKRSTLSTVDT